MINVLFVFTLKYKEVLHFLVIKLNTQVQCSSRYKQMSAKRHTELL